MASASRGRTRIPVRGKESLGSRSSRLYSSGSSTTSTPRSSTTDLSGGREKSHHKSSLPESRLPRSTLTSRLRTPRTSSSLLRHSASDRSPGPASTSTSRSSSIDLSNRLLRASVSLEKLASFKDYRCFNCNTKDELLSLCANCRQVGYCSKQCQQAHWQEHKSYCRMRNPAYFDKTNHEQVQWFVDLALVADSAESTNGPCSSRSSDQRSTNSSNSSNGDSLPPAVLSYLLDAFRLRCFDERQMAAIFPNRPEDVLLKFVRFLHAFKGSKLLNFKMGKSEYYSACNEAFYRHKIAELASGKGYEHLTNNYPDTNKVQHEDLRALHTYICGPIRLQSTDEGVFNII